MNFNDRPYFQLGIAELELPVSTDRERRGTNLTILAELKHRIAAAAPSTHLSHSVPKF